MSERVPQDKLSKTVQHKCKRVIDFIATDGIVVTKYDADSEKNSNTAYEEDEDLQNILAEMEGTDVNLNKTFPEHKLREIERRNAILMTKLIKNNHRPNQYGCVNVPSKVASATINRRRQQEKINRDNLVIWNII